MYENINIPHSNFCVGPQAGTYCTVDTSSTAALMRVKNSSGSPLFAYPFYPNNILNVDSESGNSDYKQVLGLTYVGPKDSDYFAGMSFYTFERQKGLYSNHSSQCLLRRWLLNIKDSRLDLVETFKLPYNSYAAAIEHYVTELDFHAAPGDGVITLPTTSGLAKYDVVMLGPSVDIDNENDLEYCYVHSVISPTEVEIRTLSPYTPPLYQYSAGDAVTIVKDLFIFHNEGVIEGGSYTVTGGSLTKVDLANYGAEIESNSSSLYLDVGAARWSSLYGTVSFVKQTNLLLLDLYDYEVTRSITFNNIESNKKTIIPVYDIDYNGYVIYRLQKKTTKKDDDGNLSTSTWTNYNFQADTFQPYSASLSLVMTPNRILKRAEPIEITATVRDQYGGTLQDKIITFSKEGGDGFFTPASPQEYSDQNGKYVVDYTAGNGYDGTVIIKANAIGSSSETGSSYVWCYAEIKSLSTFYSAHGNNFLTQILINSQQLEFKQIEPYFSSIIKPITRSKFSNPGGHWTSRYAPGGSNTVVKQEYLPMQNPAKGDPGVDYNTPSRLTIQQINALWEPELPYTYMKFNQVLSTTNTLYVDQTYISRHYTYGHTDTTEINQFIFVQEAWPVFFSEKNPVTTHIWLRLRPQAFSLNPATLKIEIKEHSYAGVEDWRDITSEGTITFWDAGGDLENPLFGLDFYWPNPNGFHHNGIVYVRIEVYDQSPIEGGLGNRITTDYWFKLIPDFKAPYLENLSPFRNAIDVSANTNISFEIKDNGAGVDIDSLELYMDYRQITPITTKYSGHHYEVFYSPTHPFDYSSEIDMNVKVADIYGNIVVDGWKFTVEKSAAPWFDRDNFTPRLCVLGMPRTYNYVAVQVYGMGDGVDTDSIEMRIGGYKRNITMFPVVYRQR